jgi:hypothetical protein
MMTGEPSISDDSAVEAEGRYGQILVALFLLGLVMFHPLVLDVFDLMVPASGQEPEIKRSAMLFGMPLLYVYVFFAWGLLIALLAFVVERASRLPGQRAGTAAEGEIE